MEFLSVFIYVSIYIGLIGVTFYLLTFLSGKKRKDKFLKDSQMPFASVMIPAYNEEKSIASTIESILKSDYPGGFEVIVIDDGSKDNTLKIAKKYESKQVKVFTKENAGKARAMNFALTKVKGEIIFSMDADTFVEPDTMRKMVRYFRDKEVMSVTPAMLVYKPKSLLQRIQHIEYLLGVFLRRVFAFLNAVYIAPGAFSAYRKVFFDKYGGYDENNITEDLELALRIQYNGYQTENCPYAPVYTIVPKTFKPLLIQRRRWYYGLMKNFWSYRRIMSPKYGDLGLFVLPLAWVCIFFSVFIVIYMFFKILFDVKSELLLLNSVNFDFLNLVSINNFFIKKVVFLFFSNPMNLFILVFFALFGLYIYYAFKKTGKIQGLGLNLVFFFLFFAILFGFWWIISIIYMFFTKTLKWR